MSNNGVSSKNTWYGLFFFYKKSKKIKLLQAKPKWKRCKKNMPKIPLDDIFAGMYPGYQTYKLKTRLITEGYIEDKCSICGWNKKPKGSDFTPCELDHINGVPTDHRFENLRLICPNCHSLTETYRFRRGKTNESLGRKLLDENEANSTNS